MNKWKKKYKKLRKKYLVLNQGSLLHCYSCGWNTIIPYDEKICLNCHYWEDKMKEKDQHGRKLPLEGHKEDCPHGQTGWAKCTCEETH